MKRLPKLNNNKFIKNIPAFQEKQFVMLGGEGDVNRGNKTKYLGWY